MGLINDSNRQWLGDLKLIAETIFFVAAAWAVIRHVRIG